MIGIVVHGPGQLRDTWSVDHYNSDSVDHVYCDNCLVQIPDFLVRYASELTGTQDEYGEPLTCEGCGYEVGTR